MTTIEECPLELLEPKWSVERPSSCFMCCSTGQHYEFERDFIRYLSPFIEDVFNSFDELKAFCLPIHFGRKSFTVLVAVLRDRNIEVSRNEGYDIVYDLQSIGIKCVDASKEKSFVDDKTVVIYKILSSRAVFALNFARKTIENGEKTWISTAGFLPNYSKTKKAKISNSEVIVCSKVDTRELEKSLGIVSDRGTQFDEIIFIDQKKNTCQVTRAKLKKISTTVDEHTKNHFSQLRGDVQVHLISANVSPNTSLKIIDTLKKIKTFIKLDIYDQMKNELADAMCLKMKLWTVHNLNNLSYDQCAIRCKEADIYVLYRMEKNPDWNDPNREKPDCRLVFSYKIMERVEKRIRKREMGTNESEQNLSSMRFFDQNCFNIECWPS